MNYLKIEGNPSLIKDNSSKAILNTNEFEYKNYILSKSQKDSDMKKINKMEEELSSLKEDILEIKSLLVNILNGSK